MRFGFAWTNNENSGANDLAVTVSCFTVSGNPNNTRFDVVVLQ